MNEVVAAGDKKELIQLAVHPSPERHIPARARCEREGIVWKLSDIHYETPPKAEEKLEDAEHFDIAPS